MTREQRLLAPAVRKLMVACELAIDSSVMPIEDSLALAMRKELMKQLDSLTYLSEAMPKVWNPLVA